MKKTSLLSGIALGLTILAATLTSHAIPINLGQTGGSPAGPSDELVRLDNQISMYDEAYDANLPAGTLTGSPGQVAGSGTAISLNVTGWDYILLKWADTDQFYYLGTTTGSVTFDSTVFNGNNQPQALSHYEFFNPYTPTSVPDGGSTAVLLGAAMSGLGLVVRRLKTK